MNTQTNWGKLDPQMLFTTAKNELHRQRIALLDSGFTGLTEKYDTKIVKTIEKAIDYGILKIRPDRIPFLLCVPHLVWPLSSQIKHLELKQVNEFDEHKWMLGSLNNGEKAKYQKRWEKVRLSGQANVHQIHFDEKLIRSHNPGPKEPYLMFSVDFSSRKYLSKQIVKTFKSPHQTEVFTGVNTPFRATDTVAFIRSFPQLFIQYGIRGMHACESYFSHILPLEKEEDGEQIIEYHIFMNLFGGKFISFHTHPNYIYDNNFVSPSGILLQ